MVAGDNSAISFAAVSDGGSMVDIISIETAQRLRNNNIVHHIEDEPSPFNVSFGNKAKTRVNHFIRGKSLIDKVAVAPARDSCINYKRHHLY